jgi:hypothetical protein
MRSYDALTDPPAISIHYIKHERNIFHHTPVLVPAVIYANDTEMRLIIICTLFQKLVILTSEACHAE